MHDEINVWGYMELLPKYLTEQSNLVAFPSCSNYLLKCWQFFFELNSKGLYLIPEKKREKKIVVLCLHSP